MNITTERLLLRTIELKDAESVFKYRSDAEANKFQGWIPENLKDVEDFIQNKVCASFSVPDTWYQLVIIIKESGELIGDIGIHFLGSESDQIEIGITVDKNYQRKGFASETLSKVMNYMFTKLSKHRIIASIDPDNIASKALVERLGFRKEAHHKKSLKLNGVWVDDLVYAILQEEYLIKSLPHS